MQPLAEIGEADWRPLTYSVRRGDSILLLGQDLANGPEDDRQVLADVLAAELYAEMNPGEAVPAGQEFTAVATEYSNAFGRNVLEGRVIDFYDARAAEALADPVFDALAQLPVKTIVSSRHDDAMAQALVRAGKQPQIRHYDYTGGEADVPEGTVEAPLLYQLYGVRTQGASMVLTEFDLLDFLAAVAARNPPIPRTLASLFAKRSTTFLFLGFGLRHWHLRLLLHVLKANNLNRSFALEGQHRREVERAAMFYREGYKIWLLSHKLDAFILELSRRAGSGSTPPETATPGAHPSTVNPSGPRVFISYTHEDRDFVTRLTSGLLARQVDVWVDKRRLEVGDAYNEVIREHIEGAHYFLLVQSPSLAARERSYVFKEIAIAEEIQGMLAPGLKFMLPIARGKFPTHEGLASVVLPSLRQRYEISQIESDGDIAELASQISRDFQRRARKG